MLEEKKFSPSHRTEKENFDEHIKINNETFLMFAKVLSSLASCILLFLLSLFSDDA